MEPDLSAKIQELWDRERIRQCLLLDTAVGSIASIAN
jgi:hypothetical protein